MRPLAGIMKGTDEKIYFNQQFVEYYSAIVLTIFSLLYSLQCKAKKKLLLLSSAIEASLYRVLVVLKTYHKVPLFSDVHFC